MKMNRPQIPVLQYVTAASYILHLTSHLTCLRCGTLIPCGSWRGQDQQSRDQSTFHVSQTLLQHTHRTVEVLCTVPTTRPGYSVTAAWSRRAAPALGTQQSSRICAWQPPLHCFAGALQTLAARASSHASNMIVAYVCNPFARATGRKCPLSSRAVMSGVVPPAKHAKKQQSFCRAPAD